MISFTDALHTELRSSGVRVLAVNPGPVPTEFQESRGYEPERVRRRSGHISAEQVVPRGHSQRMTAAAAR